MNREQLSRYGIKAQDVMDAVASLGGKTVGTVFEGAVRHPISNPPARNWRNDADKIASIRLMDAQGRAIPMANLVEIKYEEGRAKSNVKTFSAEASFPPTSGAAISPASSPMPKLPSPGPFPCRPATISAGVPVRTPSDGHSTAHDRRFRSPSP